MAKLPIKIKQFLLNLWNWRKNRRLRKINKKLATAVLDQHAERKEFLHEFRFYLRKYLKKDASGKYIPLKGKNKAEIYEHIMHKYGDRLAELNVKFSEDLKISL